MTFTQFCRRIVDENATTYVVTRPPVEVWHDSAIQRLASTGKASIVFVSDLHTKLLVAKTDAGDMVLLGSANFTQHSLSNREIGVAIRGVGSGVPIVNSLVGEAADIYRTPGRTIYCKRKFA